MKKRSYELPIIEIIDVEYEDVILASNLNTLYNLDWSDTNYDGEVWGEK